MSAASVGPFRRLLALLPPSRRRGLFGVAAIILFTALFETVGVASILPFMAVVMDPGIVERTPALAEAMAWLGAETRAEVTILIGIGTILLIALGNAANAINLWSQTRYLTRTSATLQGELFRGYLAAPYSLHVQRDAASLLKVMGGDVGAALNGFLTPILNGTSRALVALLLMGLVVWRDPMVALGIAVVLGGSYALIYKLVHRRQERIGAEVNRVRVILSRTSLEGLGGIKELRVLGREAESASRYLEALEVTVRASVNNALVGNLPRYLIEVVAFGGIVAITLALLAVGDATTAIPTLSLYAFAGYRLMPALQIVYGTAIGLRYNEAAIASLEADLAMVRANERVGDERTLPGVDALPLKEALKLEGVGFSYPGAQRPALDQISLHLPRNTSLGLVGRTGSGKTTLADLLLGLYAPAEGSFTVDGTPIDASNVRAWRRSVGYVPQTVFLANATVAQNIALGLDPDSIDPEAVRRAARMAQAEEFIADLPQGYDTLVGERGVRLSGGQRQRLGIARALYHDPDVLVFDEATSALDGMTEDAVMDAIRSLSSGRTIVLIAHRIRTVEACDQILMLDQGRVVAQGSHAELVEGSRPFRTLLGRGAGVA